MQYNVILADPPWWYNNRKTGGERKSKTKFNGGAMKHYQLIKDKPMKRFFRWKVSSLADENCALFLWATMPKLDFAIECLKEAGFRYVTTAFVWVKTTDDGEKFKYGPGYYTASNAEIVLLGLKGKMPPKRKMTPSILKTPRGAHSLKPKIHHLISGMYPEAESIELFARQPHLVWDVWGNEVR